MRSPAARRIIILGAQSAIAEAAARRFAADGARLVLAGENAGALNEIADDLVARGATHVYSAPVDFAGEADPQARMHEFVDRIGGASLILIALGGLGDQKRAEKDFASARRIAEGNFTVAMVWALAAANFLERQRTGTLMAIGAAAGDRGRRSDYVHAAAKAGLGVFMQGVAHRLAQSDARAVVIKPGAVATPMSGGLDRSKGVWSSPDEIAAIIQRAADSGGPVVYAPARLRWRSLAMRFLPAAIVHRTNL